ncbi:MAG: class I SAM-dependent methyltransferase [Eubacterium sp.]|nr:class I SAM-dependent methyltransferase [Eubacterium sp.]
MENVELFYQPMDDGSLTKDELQSEMSRYDRAFLSGMLKLKKPKKILEIGISGGATTSLILYCLDVLGIHPQVYSVDITKQWYVDPSKVSGHIAKERSEAYGDAHQFMLGHSIAYFIDEIGDEIDFVIIDTMHSLPGELLDYISVKKHLAKDATIVFHDVSQNLLGINLTYGVPFEYASLVTLCAISGKKYIGDDDSNIENLANIGAVVVDGDFDGDVDNLFQTLFVNWNYIPDELSLEEYRVRIEKDYGQEYLALFEKALAGNRFALYRRRGAGCTRASMIKQLEEKVAKAKEVYIYGNEKLANQVERYLNKCYRIQPKRVVTKEEETIPSVHILKGKKEDVLIVLGIGTQHHYQVLTLLHQLGLEKNVFPYNGTGFYEFLEIMDEELLEGNDFINGNSYEQSIHTARFL